MDNENKTKAENNNMNKCVYLEILDFVPEPLFDTLPLLRDIVDSFAQRLQQTRVAQSAESAITLPDTIHFRLIVNHVVETFL